jgi:hypothetical protein
MNMKKNPSVIYLIWTFSHLTCKAWRSGHVPPDLALKSLHVDRTFSQHVQRDSQSIQPLFHAHHTLIFLIKAVCVLCEL